MYFSLSFLMLSKFDFSEVFFTDSEQNLQPNLAFPPNLTSYKKRLLDLKKASIMYVKNSIWKWWKSCSFHYRFWCCQNFTFQKFSLQTRSKISNQIQHFHQISPAPKRLLDLKRASIVYVKNSSWKWWKSWIFHYRFWCCQNLTFQEFSLQTRNKISNQINLFYKKVKWFWPFYTKTRPNT